MEVLAAVPVKPFGVAKARLAPMVPARARTRLGREMAARTLAAAAAAGAHPAVITGDRGVAAWARRLGVDVVGETSPGLDQAAHAAVAAAAPRRAAWAVIHADLPLITSEDLVQVLNRLAEGRVVLAPSHDGGSSVIAAIGAGIDFAYGPGSFHRHLLRCLPRRPVVVTRPGLAADLDSPGDLRRAAAAPGGAWLAPYLTGAHG